MAERIRRIVFLDAGLALSGQSFLDTWTPEAAEARRKAAREINGVRVLPPPATAPPKPGVPEDPIAAWFQRRLTPYPFAPFETPLVLKHPLGNGVPCTYVAFTKSPEPLLEESRQIARSQTDWQWAELPLSHGGPALAPQQVADVLHGVA